MEYTAEDEVIIAKAWEHLKLSCEKVCHTERGWNYINRAYFLAKEAHKGVRRRSGEPYFLHPIAVAQIVVDEIGLGAKSVAAALLHDVVEDTDYTVEDIEHVFGPKVATMVDGLTKMSGVFAADTSQQAEYFRKVLLTLSDDVRVILIKLADRLHNMRTLGSMPANKQIKITGETLYLFAPLAYRLGLFSIKSELEDLCMKYRFPIQYEEINAKLELTKSRREELIEHFTAPIIKTLDSHGIEYEIAGRVKSVYSIWTKMQNKQIPFEEVYDLFAVRVVFKAVPFPSEKTQCWQIYSSITDLYTPKPDRLHDWISIPKDNGYEALHSTVMGPDGVWVEVQIRTQRMDEIAERGLAAHWKYKKATITKNEDEFDKWLKKIRAALSSPSENAVEFLDNFKLSLYTSEILVFTPKGEAKKLPLDATALDFAYEIHTKVGNKAIGAKINHTLQPITARIKSGDQIEIVTAESGRPKAEWLNYVTTSKATQAIKAYLKSDQENNIERGIEIFEREMEKLSIPISGRVIRKVLPAYGVNNKDEFYSKVGANIITLEDLSKVLKRNSSSKMFKFWTLFLNKAEDVDPEQPAEQKLIKDVSPEREEFVIAECCNPIPGDQVVGYRNMADGTIEVHKASCKELNRLASQFGGNIVKDEIKWAQQKSISYLSTIKLRGVDRVGLLLDLVKVVSGDFNSNIREVNTKSYNGIFEGRVSLYVKDSDSLEMVINKLRLVKGIERVMRIDNETKGSSI
ncbi:MAG: RelA/SpoT family protein [Rikenellaceae bacterium]